jgi:hypothetical protein
MIDLIPEIMGNLAVGKFAATSPAAGLLCEFWDLLEGRFEVI